MKALFIIIPTYLFVLSVTAIKFNGTTTIHLPGRGILRGGVTNGGARCFLGIPFAQVNKRWYPASVYQATWEGERDCTLYGPYCPQTAIETYDVDSPGSVSSERDCLNLNVYIPDGNYSKLPVLVWIYGGGFTQGSNSLYIYNPENVISYAKSISHPVIIVSINYRLGILGFLAGNDLAAAISNDTSLTSNSKAVGNWGLMDQKMGLEWVQKNIAYFGGDPERVTVYGESAGSISVHYHMLLHQGLFKRAILQSGTIITSPPMDIASDQTIFNQLVDKYGIDKNLDSQGKVDSLRQINATTLVNDADSLGHIPTPHTDNVFIPRDLVKQSFESNGYGEGIDAVIIGDCKDEGTLFREYNGLTTPEGYKTYIQNTIPQNLRQEFMEIYPAPQSNNTTEWQTLGTRINGDFMFHAPTHQYAKYWVTTTQLKTWYYHFDQPVQALIKIFSDTLGLPPAVHHASDILPAFLRTDILTAHEAQVGYKLVEYWLRFAYGEDLSQHGWSTLATGKVMTFGPDAISRVVTDDRAVTEMNFYSKYLNETLYQ